MATLIRLKRKTTPGNNNVVLAAGEAYYNLADKRLYVGSQDSEIVNENKKHLTEITAIDAGPTVVKFQIGEDVTNVYEKKITADAIEGVISNASHAENVTTYINNKRISDIFTTDRKTVKKASTAAVSDAVKWKNFN